MNETLLPSQPVLLVGYDTKSKSWKVSEEAKTLLLSLELKYPLKVCAIAGAYRQGKSFIMNHLLGVSKDGFKLGHQIDGKTRGIWIWIKKKSGFYLVALDTEGLWDVTCADENRDTKILTFSVLMSSFLIINLMQTLDSRTFQSLSTVGRVVQEIIVDETKPDQRDLLKHHFPGLMFLIRDFSLSLEDYQNNPDKYMFNALESDPDVTDEAIARDKVKKLIKLLFPTLKCRTLCTPLERPEEQIMHIENKPELIRPLFKQQVTKLIQELTQLIPAKTLNSIQLNGKEYLHMLNSYVEAINKGKLPNIGISYENVMVYQIESALEEALKPYSSFKEKIKQSLPIEETRLLSEHEQVVTQCEGILVDRIFGKENRVKAIMKLKETTGTFQNGQANGMLYELVEKNKTASYQLCRALVEQEFYALSQKIQRGGYRTYEEYQEEWEQYETGYQNKARGPAALEVLRQVKKEQEKDVKLLVERLKLDEEKKKSIAAQGQLEQQALEFQKQQEENEQRFFLAERSLQEQEKRSQQLNDQLIAEREENKKMIERKQKEMEEKMEAIRRHADEETRNLLARERKNLEKDFQEKLDQNQKRFNSEIADLKKLSEEQLQQAKRDLEIARRASESHSTSAGPNCVMWYQPLTGDIVLTMGDQVVMHFKARPARWY